MKSLCFSGFLSVLILSVSALTFAQPVYAHDGNSDHVDHSDHASPLTHMMTHLKFKNGAIHAHCTWKQGPTGDGESVLTIEWKNGADHSALDLPGTFDVTLFMPEMPEMHNPPAHIDPMTDEQGAPMRGAYQISSIFFTMDGGWDVRVTLHSPDGTDETQTIHVELGSSGMDMHHPIHPSRLR
jgi:hypothetical protein